jgi:hypothetical protein
VAVVFQRESRVTVTSGGGKHHRSKKTTLYQLNFSGPLRSQTAQIPTVYHVTQIKKGRGKHGSKTIAVAVTSATLSSDGTSVRLALGKVQKKAPLTLSVSGLIGGNAIPVPTFTTNL